MEKIKGEAEMLNSLDHHHIVKFKQVKYYVNITISCMKVATNCIWQWNCLQEGPYLTLLNITKKKVTIYFSNSKGNKLKDHEASKIIKGVLEAVSYLHKYDIAHRDIKPGNKHINR